MSTILFGVLLALAAIAGAATRFIPGMKSDNIIEEKIEEIIYEKTGLDIDLSPDTDESGTDSSGMKEI